MNNLVVEYLVFVDSKIVKCADINSFEHLLQSDPEIEIKDKKIEFKKLFLIDYSIQSGNIGDTEKVYFHLKFSVTKTSEIDELTELLRHVKSVFSIVTTKPQILYDGISQYYANRAYPRINDIENLMRKLITKFMLMNVGADWTKEKVPDDVKNSINSDNRDSTYLHSVDFIQLKNFLFSEKYNTRKDKLIDILKKSEDLSELNLNELKLMIPKSNWDRYFSKEIPISQDKLSKQWSELYILRCKIAHNKTFNKIEFTRVKELIENLKPIIEKAIEKLDHIAISKIDRENLEEEIVGNFSQKHGEFLSLWKDFESLIFDTVDAKIEDKGLVFTPRNFLRDLNLLIKERYFNHLTTININSLRLIRNRIVHFDEDLPEERVQKGINTLYKLNEEIEGWL